MYYRAGKPVNIKYQSKATFVRALAPNLNTIAGDMLTTLLPMIDDHGDAIIVPLRIHFEKSGSVVVVVRDGSGVCPPDPVDPLPQSRVVPSMLVQWIAERLALEGIGVREVTSRQAGDRRMIEMILDVERASISVVRSTTTMDGLDIVMSSDNADLRRRIMGRLSVV